MEVKDKKYEEELAEDIMKILTCYSARYYGARGGRKKKIKVENEPVESNGIWKRGKMSEVSEFYENNQHLFDDAIKMRESGNEKEANLIIKFILLND